MRCIIVIHAYKVKGTHKGLTYIHVHVLVAGAFVLGVHVHVGYYRDVQSHGEGSSYEYTIQLCVHMYMCNVAMVTQMYIPYFLEILPRRHLISWSSLARRHFEGGQISRAATKVLVTSRTMGKRAHCALFRININITYVYMRAIMTTLYHMQREFEGGV